VPKPLLEHKARLAEAPPAFPARLRKWSTPELSSPIWPQPRPARQNDSTAWTRH